MRPILRPLFIFLLFGHFIASCGSDSNFSGSGAKADKTAPKDESDDDSKSDKDKKDKGSPESKSTMDAATDPESPTPPAESAVPSEPIPPPLPENAVTKGSFTAYADPKNPLPGQPYWILIEVKLPSNVATYQATDISGRLTGSDGYSRGVGRDSKGPTDGVPLPPDVDPKLIPQDKFEFAGTIAKLGIWVPGAAQLVRDTITIRSDLLKESQTIAIIFQ